MSLRIDQDRARFDQILRGKVRENLKKYINSDEMLARRGKKTVSVPVPRIDLPRFTFGSGQKGGAGAGDGEVGDVLGQDEVEGEGQGEAGDKAGEHVQEVELTFEELAQMLAEELELPNIEPRGKKSLQTIKTRYTGIYTSGPESLRHFKRTYKQALKRQIASGTYDPRKPMVIPYPEDRRYRSWKVTELPETNAVVIYMMDVSGSMGAEQKEIVRTESFWIDTWLKSQYDGIETRYIIHDAVAREVDVETFFTTRESGGTMISSAYKLAWEVLQADYPAAEWNIYLFQFSDGDNWSGEDTNQCLTILKQHMLPIVNQFAYGQVHSQYGSGQFLRDLHKAFADKKPPNLVTSEVPSRDAIYDSLREFLGKGR
jgi:uncharacterized protein